MNTCVLLHFEHKNDISVIIKLRSPILCLRVAQYLFPADQFNTYSMKQPDLYYYETIKMTSQT